VENVDRNDDATTEIQDEEELLKLLNQAHNFVLTTRILSCIA
jgi:hypothetical protein